MGCNPYREYHAASVTGKSSVELAIMVFDGLVSFLEQAKQRMQANDDEGSQRPLSRARTIVLHLIGLVNEEGDSLAVARLRGLYFFCLEKIITAGVNQSVSDVDQALRVLGTLQETWLELEARERTGKAPEPQLESTAVA